MTDLDFNTAEGAWHQPFAKLPVLLQLQYESAFLRLVYGSAAPTTAAERKALGSDVDEATGAGGATVRFDSVPTVLSVMNLSITFDDITDVARNFGRPPPQMSDDTEDGGSSASIYDYEFTWPALTALYDYLVPQQNQLIGTYLGLCSLLDADGVGAVRLSDLRHALCRLGGAPLTDAEFNHMLFRHRVLHRTTVSVFELMRLLLDIPVSPIEASLRDMLERAGQPM
jgi:hypothetical protein